MSGVLRNFALSYCLVITTVFAGFPQASHADDPPATLAPAAKEVTQVSEIDVWGITQWDHVSADGAQRRGLHEEREGYFRHAGPQSNASFKTELSFRVNGQTGHLQVVNVNHQKDPGCFDEFKVESSLVIDHGGYLIIVPHDNPEFVAIERPQFPQDTAVAGYWRIRKADFMTTFENDPPLALWHYFSADEGISPVNVADLVSPRRNKLNDLRVQYAPKAGVIEIPDTPSGDIWFKEVWGKVYPHESSDLEVSLEETASMMRYLTLSLMLIGAVKEGGLPTVQARMRKIGELLDKIESKPGSLSPQLRTEVQLIREHLFGIFSGEDPKLKEVFNASFQNYLVNHEGTPVRDRGTLHQSYMNQLSSLEDALGVVAGELDSGPTGKTASWRPADETPLVLTLSMRDLIYNKNSPINTRSVAVSLNAKIIGWIGILGALTTIVTFAVTQSMAFYQNLDAIRAHTINWKAGLGFAALMIFIIVFHQVIKVVCKKSTGNKDAKAAFIQSFSKIFDSLNNIWHTMIRYRLFFGFSPKTFEHLRKGLPSKLPEGEELSVFIIELLAKKKAAREKNPPVAGDWTSEDQERLDNAIKARDTAFDHAVASRRLSTETLKQLRIWLAAQGKEVSPEDLMGMIGALMADNDPKTKLSGADMHLAIQAAETMAAYDVENFDGDIRKQGLGVVDAKDTIRFERAWKLAQHLKHSLNPLVLAGQAMGKASSYMINKPITRGSRVPDNQMYRIVLAAVAFDALTSFIPELIARASVAPPDKTALFNPATGLAPDLVAELLFQVYFMFVSKTGWMSNVYNPAVSARPPEYKNPSLPYRYRLGLVFKDHLFSWNNHWEKAIHFYIALFWFRLIFRVSFAFLASSFDYLYGVMGLTQGPFKGFEMPSLDYMVWYLFLCGPFLTIINYSTVKLGTMANIEHPNLKIQNRKERLIGALVGIITGWFYWVVKKPFMHPEEGMSIAYGVQNGIDLYHAQHALLQVLEPTLVAGAAGYLFYRVLKSRRACAH